MGLVISRPGAKPQPFHMDGPHLKSWPAEFQAQAEAGAAPNGTLPIHALNVFIPLIDFKFEHGATELVPGSHDLHVGRALDIEIARQAELLEARQGMADSDSDSDGDKGGGGGGGGEAWRPPGSVAPLLKMGDALVYDQRTVHRGTANTSNETRPLLYLLFKRPWYQETINFGEEALFSAAKVRAGGAKRKGKGKAQKGRGAI